MATVYLAEDVKHNRKVALKVLKPELAAMVGAERFLAEIKTTANLQHPHILPLFDSGEADRFLFYVMPYVEGESLRDRIDRERQLPVDVAVRIATDMAEALDYAHRHGVIHRDIKPGNVLIHDGRPLIADFGIALAVGAAAGDRLTETGLSVGTPHYMSPEQATGDQAVGPATDTYALGCVLYEMLVGDPPYIGSTAQAILGKIIAGDPVSATEQRPSIPANVDAALRKALERLPADRFTSAQDFVRALGDEHFHYGEPVAGLAGASASPWNRLTMAMTAIAVASTLTLAWALLRPESPNAVERFSLDIPDPWFPNNQFSVSPDGSAIVFQGFVEGSVQLFLRRLGDLVASPVPGTEGGSWPAISPDGREVAFGVGGQVKVTGLQGGVVRTVADSAFCCQTWGTDGFIYYTLDPRRTIARVPAGGGAVEMVIDVDEVDGTPIAGVHVLPGGEVAVFTVYANPRRVEAMRLATGERKVLTPGNNAFPLPLGYVMFGTSEGQIMVAPFDAGTLELTAAAVPVIEGVQVQNNNTFYGVSESGTVVYWSGGRASPDLEFIWVTRSGGVSPVDPGWTFDPGIGNLGWSLSPDETRLAVKVGADLRSDIWIKELPDGPLSRLTFREGEERSPKWSPDGESVTFLSNRAGNFDVWTKRVEGVGDSELLFDHDVSLAEADWSPDGEWLTLRTTGTAVGVIGGRDIIGVRPGVDRVTRPLVVSDFDETAPSVSPDGRWLAYSSDETGRREVFIRPFPDTEGRKIQVSDGGGRTAVWAHNGRELFYVGTDNVTAGDQLMVADFRAEPLFEVTERRVLFAVPDGFYLANFSTQYNVTEDDQRFLMARVADAGAEQNRGSLILVQNFFEEVRQRAGN